MWLLIHPFTTVGQVTPTNKQQIKKKIQKVKQELTHEKIKIA